MSTRSRTPDAGSAGGLAEAPAPVARVATNQLRRMRRIVDAAVELAEKGGFEAVRLRDVAERSEVALGTLYKYFRSKEDILLFALNEEIERLEASLASRAIPGDDPTARLTEFFRRATRALARRPQFARALIRSMATGDKDTAVKIAGVQLRVARMISAAMRGEVPDLGSPLDPGKIDSREHVIAFVMNNVWFSALVGWSSGLNTERGVIEHVRLAADLILGDSRS